MKTAQYKDSLVIFPEGRIDAQNADSVLKELEDSYPENPGKMVFLDFTGVSYVSSMGLRTLLSLQKKREGKLNLINVSDDVMEIFRQTGFTTLMNIRGPMKQISVSGLKQIGRGMTADVYELDDERVIKVYNDNPVNTLAFIEQERLVSRSVFMHGIPTAIPFDILMADGRVGVVFETIKAKMLFAFLHAHPERYDEMIGKEITLLWNMHHTEFEKGELPDMKEKLLTIASGILPKLTTEEKWQKFKESVQSIPDRLTMIHGDYHPGNIMVQESGDLVLIDVGDATTGHPVIELAAMMQPLTLFEGILSPRQVMEDFFAMKDLTDEKEQETLNFYKGTIRYWRASLAAYIGTDDEAELKRMEDELRVYSFLIYMCKMAAAPRGDEEATASILRMMLDEYLKRTDRIGHLSEWWKDW